MTQRRPRDPDPSVFAAATPAFHFPRAPHDVCSVTWVGHSTLLVQIDGLNVLTDPMWSERASPLTFLGPRRWTPPGIRYDALPPIDAVTISHNHYDHLDDATVRRLAQSFPQATWIAPLGVGSFLQTRGVQSILELDWWGSARVSSLEVTAIPARHFSARGVGDRCQTLWCGFVLRGRSTRVLFAGDTGLHPEFERIASQLGPFDCVTLPIGAYEPRWFMERVHMNPADALEAYRRMCDALPGTPLPAFIPIHWGTFKLTDEAMDDPPRVLTDCWRAAGLPSNRLWVLSHGETRTF